MDIKGYNLDINWSKQNRHLLGTTEYIHGRSVLTADPEMLLARYLGFGEPIVVNGVWIGKERFTHTDFIGEWKSKDGNASESTKNGVIHYSKLNGVHIVPALPYKKSI